MTGIRAYLVDPAQLSREGLTAVLEDCGIEVVGCCSNVMGPADQAGASSPFDVAVVDCSALPHDVRSTIHKELRRRFANNFLVGLIDSDDRESLRLCLDNDFDGVVPKTTSGPVFKKVLQVIAEGERYFPVSMIPAHGPRPNAESLDMKPVASGHQTSGLTPLERQILQQLAAGKSNKAMASALNCTEVTIKAHIKRILRKISANNRTQAAVWALTHGIDSPADVETANLLDSTYQRSTH